MAIAEENTTSNTGIGIASGENATQSFTVHGSENIICPYIKLRFGRQTGATSGSVRLGVYADDGSDNPTGAELVGVDVAYSDLVSGAWNYNFNWHTFTFASAYTFTAGVKYVIKITSTMNHYARWRISTSNTYADGLAKLNGTGWSSPGYDFTFQVYKVSPTEADFKADATLTKGFLADAFLSQGITVDATLGKGFLVNATLQGTVESDFTADATLQGTVESNFTADATLKSVDDETRHKISFSFNKIGAIATTTALDGARSFARNARVARVYLHVGTPGVSGTTKIDVNVGGVTLFTDQDERPYINGGSTEYLRYNVPTIRNISANSIITVDIDEIAVGAEDLSVILELNTTTSYTHTVREVNILEDEILINRDNTQAYLSDKLQLQIVFDEPMNTAYEPTFLVTANTASSAVTVPTGGTWTTTYEKHDTYVTPLIDALAEDYEGLHDVFISDAKNIFSEAIETYASSIDLINGTLTEFEYDFIKTVNNNILINSDVISRFKYSLDDITFSAWQDYAPNTSVDITDVAIGGTATEGLKTLYLVLEDIFGNQLTKELTCYYKTTLNAITDVELTETGKPNFYMLRFSLPSDAHESKIKRFEIYMDDVKIGTIDDPYPRLISGGGLNIANDAQYAAMLNFANQEITYPMNAAEIYLSDGSKVSVSAGNVVSDYPTFSEYTSTKERIDRFDALCVDEDGNYIVVKGVTGVINRSAYSFEISTTMASTNAGTVLPIIPDNYTLLYYIRLWTPRLSDLSNLIGISSTSVDLQTMEEGKFDMRDTFVKFLINVFNDTQDHVILIKTVTESGLEIDYTYNYNVSEFNDVDCKEIEAYSAQNGGGIQYYSGSFIQDGVLTNNTLYFKFVKGDS